MTTAFVHCVHVHQAPPGRPGGPPLDHSLVTLRQEVVSEAERKEPEDTSWARYEPEVGGIAVGPRHAGGRASMVKDRAFLPRQCDAPSGPASRVVTRSWNPSRQFSDVRSLKHDCPGSRRPTQEDTTSATHEITTRHSVLMKY